MLRLLLDEHLAPAAATDLRMRDPQLHAVALRDWEGGKYIQAPDEAILTAAYRQGLTVVTRDARTIRPLLSIWGKQQRGHGGVIFVDHRTIPECDIGGLELALLELFDEHGNDNWVNHSVYLRRTLRNDALW